MSLDTSKFGNMVDKETAQRKSKDDWAVFGVGLFSFFLRIFFSFFIEFNDDPVRVYAQGLDLYLNHKISATGASIVYTGTSLPGALQSLLAGLPLFVSGGWPWGLGCFVAVLNFIAVVVTYRLFRALFPKIKPLDLAVFVFFAPWTVIFTSVWNPSFLPIFSSLFFWGLLKVSENKYSFVGAFWIGLAMICTLQLHLSFVLLPLTLGVAILMRWLPIPNLKGILSGLLLGGAGLIPFIMKPAVAGGSKEDFLARNIQFHWDHFKQWPSFFLRFLSFPTGETTRFIGTHHGFGGALTFLGQHRLWIPSALFVITCSVVLVLLGMSFYLKPEHWREVLGTRLLKAGPQRKGSRQSASKFTGKSTGTSASTPALKLFMGLALVVPVVTGFLFSFSSQGPSSHTFWILVPLSFFPCLYVLERRKFFEKGARILGVRSRVLWYSYCTVATLFCLGSYTGVERETLIESQVYASAFSEQSVSWEEIPQSYRPYVSQILRVIQREK